MAYGLGLLLLAAAPAAAADQAFRLRLGLFTPDGGGEFFDELEQDFTGSADDLEDVVGGIDYQHRLGRGNLSMLISADLYEGQMDSSYRDFVDNFGDEIAHSTTLEVVQVTAGIKVDLAPEHAPVVPYVGVGGGVYNYRYEESGDFIDFSTPDDEVFSATLSTEGAVLGWYAMAGLEVPLGPYFSVFAEGRWDNAEEDDLGDDFDGLGTLDLSGRRIMGGLSWQF
jgi:hypothetical protein